MLCAVDKEAYPCFRLWHVGLFVTVLCSACSTCLLFMTGLEASTLTCFMLQVMPATSSIIRIEDLQAFPYSKFHMFHNLTNRFSTIESSGWVIQSAVETANANKELLPGFRMALTPRWSGWSGDSLLALQAEAMLSEDPPDVLIFSQ